MPLTQEEIIRTLMGARRRILAASWLVVRDVNASEDIFQNLMVKAISSGSQFESDANLLSWAFVATKNESLNWVRDRRGRALLLDTEVLNLLRAEWTEACSQSDGDRVEALEACVDGLPFQDRRLLQLRYHDGRSCGEVASKLGVKLDALYQRLSRLHRALRQCIERRLASNSPQLSREVP